MIYKRVGSAGAQARGPHVGSGLLWKPLAELWPDLELQLISRDVVIVGTLDRPCGACPLPSHSGTRLSFFLLEALFSFSLLVCNLVLPLRVVSVSNGVLSATALSVTVPLVCCISSLELGSGLVIRNLWLQSSSS